MGTTTGIAWCSHTLNLWWGCVEVSPLCDNCYAREWAKRYDRAKWGADEPRLFIKSGWNDVKKWQRAAAASDRMDSVFCGSMMDIFEKPMPLVNSDGEALGGTTGDLRYRCFDEVVPQCPNLLFLFLTKRPSNIVSMIPKSWLDNPPVNVMFGASPGTQATADQCIRQLRAAPGQRFLSIEPLLEHIELPSLEGIHWVIVGCESRAHSAGRFAGGYVEAAKAINARCKAEDIPVFNKQQPIGGCVSHDPMEWPAELRSQETFWRVRRLPQTAALAGKEEE